MPVPILQAAQYCGDSLKDCPIPLLQRLVVEATREVCREGRIWRVKLPTITLLPRTINYDLSATLPLNSVIEDIIQVRINGQPILPYNINATTPAIDQSPWPGVGGPPGNFGPECQWQNVTFSRPLQTQITLIGGWQTTGGQPMDIWLNLIPQIGSSTIPDIAWNEYVEAIEQYVKWRARVGDPSAAWYNPQLGQDNETNWKDWAGVLRTKARTGNVTPRMRVTPSDYA